MYTWQDLKIYISNTLLPLCRKFVNSKFTYIQIFLFL